MPTPHGTLFDAYQHKQYYYEKIIHCTLYRHAHLGLW